MQIEILLTILLLFVLSLLATVDMAFSHVTDVGLRRLVGEAEEHPTARSSFLRQVLENRQRFSFTLSAAIQILLVAVAVLITSIALGVFSNTRYVLLVLASGLILAGVFRQLIPLLLSHRNPEATFLFLLPLIRPFYRVMAFAADPFHSWFDRARRKELQQDDGEEEDDVDMTDDIQALIDVGEAEGIIEEEEGELIHSIIEFGDTSVGEVMTPRPDIVALPTTASVREARDIIIESKYSRLPVYRDQIDNVEGFIYVRDLLQCWAEDEEPDSISSLVRPVYFVPETKPVAKLLEEMQKAHVQLSMVIDEYGGVAGLVTVEDILEEIVGEIEDEDIGGDEAEIIAGSGGVYEVLGSTEIGKIERLFDMEIEADDFNTIAGLVINESGKVPRSGERLAFRGLQVEVLEADERRIGRLRVRRLPSENGNESIES
jgi:CBS domain containing-hemolysin-like protein